MKGRKGEKISIVKTVVVFRFDCVGRACLEKPIEDYCEVQMGLGIRNNVLPENSPGDTLENCVHATNDLYVEREITRTYQSRSLVSYLTEHSKDVF